MKVNQNFTVLIIVVLLLVMIAALVMASRSPYTCPSLTQQDAGFGTLSVKNHPGILNIAKIDSFTATHNPQTNGEYVLLPGPLVLPQGLRVAKDGILEHIQKQDPNNNPIRTIHSKSYEDALKALESKPHSPEAQQEVNQYLQYFEGFVQDNKNTTEAINNWQPVINHLKLLLQEAKTTKKTKLTPKTSPPPHWNDLWGWFKWIFVKHGGFFGLLSYFRHRIKWDIVNDVLHEKGYIQQGIGKVTGSGECTACPASWWQSCPHGTVMIGARGWGNSGNCNPSPCACDKWYQHISCEGLCQAVELNYTVPVGFVCEKIVKGVELAQDDWKKVGSRVVHTLSTAGVLPGLVKFLIGAAEVVSKILPIIGSDHWLLDDIKDVCYNFSCECNDYTANKVCSSKIKDLQTGKQCTESKYCVPHSLDFSSVASRKCPGNPGCLTASGGLCTNTRPSESSHSKFNVVPMGFLHS